MAVIPVVRLSHLFVFAIVPYYHAVHVQQVFGECCFSALLGQEVLGAGS